MQQVDKQPAVVVRAKEQVKTGYYDDNAIIDVAVDRLLLVLKDQEPKE